MLKMFEKCYPIDLYTISPKHHGMMTARIHLHTQQHFIERIPTSLCCIHNCSYVRLKEAQG